MAVFSGASNGQLQLLATFQQDIRCILSLDLPQLTQDDYLSRLGLVIVSQIPPGLNPRTMNVVKLFGQGLLFRPEILSQNLPTAVYIDWYVSGVSWVLNTGTL